MKLRKLLVLLAMLPCIAACSVRTTRAQNLGYVGQTNSNQIVFNAVSVAGPSAVLTNLGQNFHILCYHSSSTTAAFQLRLEFSFTGLTSDYHQLSDDATSQTDGCVYGQGTYPFLRANLLYYSGAGTLTANYTGIFSGSMPPTGSLNQSQTYKKILAEGVTGTGSAQTYLFNPPCGNTSGTVFFQYLTGAGAGGSYFVFPGVDSIAIFPSAISTGVIANTANVQTFQIGPNAGTFIQLNVTAAAASTYSVQYLFNCSQPGSGISANQAVGLIQPPSTSNTESTSATNTQVVDTIAGSAGNRVSVYSVSARCSAGTASLTIKDGATQIWSTGAAEVGTTTFRFQWSPGLATVTGNAAVITLSACGAGNTGTLDVQSSQN